MLTRSSFSVEKVLKLLLSLAFDEKLVSMVSFLIDLIVVHRVFNLNELWYGSFLEDLLSSLLHKPVLLLLHLVSRFISFLIILIVEVLRQRITHVAFEFGNREV
mgnify:CR=1 FL=1